MSHCIDASKPQGALALDMCTIGRDGEWGWGGGGERKVGGRFCTKLDCNEDLGDGVGGGLGGVGEGGRCRECCELYYVDEAMRRMMSNNALPPDQVFLIYFFCYILYLMKRCVQ